MRDRLSNMIQNAVNGCAKYWADVIADHLLAEGVIVPPCKVGTTLYFLYNSPYADKPDFTPRIYKTTDWYFDIDKSGIVINTSNIHSFNKEYDYHLGKTVFLTREEAEKALAENLKDNEKSCDTCAFYNEDRDNQPCCYCAENSCWVKGEEDDT